MWNLLRVPVTGLGTAQERVRSSARAASKEVARLTAVRRYDVLDSPPEGAFDRVAGLTARWFAAPMAVVSIVDTDRTWYKAAHGLAGVTQTGHHPGLCASAIGQDRPLVIPDTLADPVASTHPLVTSAPWARFYAAAPIITADGHRLGAVSVLDTRPRQVTAGDIAVLQDLAGVVLDELELRLSASRIMNEHHLLRAQAQRDMDELTEFAATLQRSLLPPALPQISGLDMACHYHTASPRNVGGDFYDVFPLSEDRWAFFLGDMCGNGPAAAAATSLVRYTLRSAALHDPDPIKVLHELNEAMLGDQPSDRFCTAMFGILQPHPDGGFTVLLGNGGHPAAIALHASQNDSAPRLVEPGGMLVGALPEARFATTTLRLSPGDTLLLYTDGLIEARPDGIDALGEDGLAERLAQFVKDPATARPISAQQFIDHILAMTRAFAQGSDDDIALLTMSVPQPSASPDTRPRPAT